MSDTTVHRQYEAFLQTAVREVFGVAANVVALTDVTPTPHSQRIPRAQWTTATDRSLTIVGRVNHVWMRPLLHVLVDAAVGLANGDLDAARARIREAVATRAATVAALERCTPMRPGLAEGHEEALATCGWEATDVVVYEPLGSGVPVDQTLVTPWTLVALPEDVARVWRRPNSPVDVDVERDLENETAYWAQETLFHSDRVISV